jgi:hypothetical protein
MYRLIAVLGTLILTACSSGGGDAAPPAPPPVNQSVGGIWQGVDNSGNDIVALVTEDGEFRFLDMTNEAQGFGTATVANGNAVTLSYTFVAPLGFTLDDGSTSATCTGSGTVQERQALSVSVNCTTALNNAYTASAALTYNATYDRDSSLATIAGLYDDLGNVLSIDSNGVLFEQDANDGCVFNGQVSVVDPAWNAYRFTFTVSNCTGQYAPMNGSSWTGIATLELEGNTNTLIAGFSGTVQGVTYSIIAALPEI